MQTPRHILRILFVVAFVIPMASVARAQCTNPKTDAARAECIKTELKGSDSTVVLPTKTGHLS
jgi:hypothetical protein